MDSNRTVPIFLENFSQEVSSPAPVLDFFSFLDTAQISLHIVLIFFSKFGLFLFLGILLVWLKHTNLLKQYHGLILMYLKYLFNLHRTEGWKSNSRIEGIFIVFTIIHLFQLLVLLLMRLISVEFFVCLVGFSFEKFCSYLKVRVTERSRIRERFFHPLAHSPNIQEPRLAFPRRCRLPDTWGIIYCFPRP